MAESRIETCDVIVIGCSMVSMTMAALLAQQGVICLSVEKHADTAIHPRAAVLQPKSVQLFERMGLYDAMQREAAKTTDDKVAIVDVESLSGRLIQKWTSHANEGIEKISPVPRLFLSQQAFEPLIREYAVQQGADLRFSTEMIGFVQDSNGVVVTVRNRLENTEYTINAKYLIACDGSRSSIRETLDISKEGYGLLSRCVTIYFEADLFKYIDGKYNGVIYVNNEAIRGVWRLDKSGKNGFMFVVHAGPRGSEESKHVGDTITDVKALQYLYDALGVDDEPFKIKFIDKWDAVCDVSEEFRRGRVFLMGDAAHTVVPHGGFGGNAGIQDAQNLAWKLSLVLRGEAGSHLLETYQQERFPIAQKTVNQVFCRYISRTAPELRALNLEKEVEIPDASLELGYNYLHSDAIVYHSSSHRQAIVENPEQACAHPGSMAHHVVVTPLDCKQFDPPVPLLKLLSNTKFVLLVGENADFWHQAAEKLAKNFPLETYRVSGEEFLAKYKISSSGAVLIRPDAFVAWHSHEESNLSYETSVEGLRRVMEHILQMK